mmetsp:Transcript_62838/g.205145  ORF Transcript_62838/g.205145 Transcript_62838/m.205145 type:complete len:378 (+) Transcript_62838:433-1566(+)
MLHGDLVALDVESEHPSILVEVAEGLEGIRTAHGHLVRNVVDDAVTRNVTWDETRVLLVAANNMLHDHEGNSIRASPGHTLPTHGDVCRWSHLVVAVKQLGTAKVGLSRTTFGSTGLDATEGGRNELHELLMLQWARCSDYHVLSRVVDIHVRLQVRLSERADVVIRAHRREAEGVVTERASMQPVVDDLARGDLALLQLTKDALLLLREVVEPGGCDQVSENLDALFQVALHHGHGVRRLLATGIHAQGGSQRLDLGLKLCLGPLDGAGQGELLDQVNSARRLLRLVPGASVQEHTNGGDLAECLLGRNADPVRQRCDHGRCLVPRHRLCQSLRHRTAAAAWHSPAQLPAQNIQDCRRHCLTQVTVEAKMTELGKA